MTSRQRVVASWEFSISHCPASSHNSMPMEAISWHRSQRLRSEPIGDFKAASVWTLERPNDMRERCNVIRAFIRLFEYLETSMRASLEAE